MRVINGVIKASTVDPIEPSPCDKCNGRAYTLIAVSSWNGLERRKYSCMSPLCFYQIVKDILKE